MPKLFVLLVLVVIAMSPAADVSGGMLDEFPIPAGGDPLGIWEADSLEIDVYTTPTLRAAVSDLVLSGFVGGQISLNAPSSYRFEYVVDVNVALTFLGGPLAVSLKDTVSDAGQFSVSENELILTRSGIVDTLGFTVSGDTLSLIQEVSLGDFSTLAASIDPDGGPPLAVLYLRRVQVAAAGTADFDGDGSVGFSDFLVFAAQFGKTSADAGFDPRFDLNSDGMVGFTDFLAFVSQFG